MPRYRGAGPGGGAVSGAGDHRTGPRPRRARRGAPSAQPLCVPWKTALVMGLLLPAIDAVFFVARRAHEAAEGLLVAGTAAAARVGAAAGGTRKHRGQPLRASAFFPSASASGAWSFTFVVSMTQSCGARIANTASPSAVQTSCEIGLRPGRGRAIVCSAVCASQRFVTNATRSCCWSNTHIAQVIALSRGPPPRPRHAARRGRRAWEGMESQFSARSPRPQVFLRPRTRTPCGGRGRRSTR
jgi:hypothetical protein